MTASFSKLEMAVTTSGLAPLCARVTLSPANRAIAKSEIHNTGFFAFTALAPHFSAVAGAKLKHLGTEATSIKNRLVGSGTPPCSSSETLDPGVVPVGRLDLQGSLPPAACTAVLHTWGIILPSAAVHESEIGTFRTWRDVRLESVMRAQSRHRLASPEEPI